MAAKAEERARPVPTEIERASTRRVPDDGQSEDMHAEPKGWFPKDWRIHLDRGGALTLDLATWTESAQLERTPSEQARQNRSASAWGVREGT